MNYVLLFVDVIRASSQNWGKGGVLKRRLETRSRICHNLSKARNGGVMKREEIKGKKKTGQD